MALPFVATALAGAALKGISTFAKPGREKLDASAFENDPDLMEALSSAKSRARNPKSFERVVEAVNRQIAPALSKQYEGLRAYKDNPALYTRALERMNQQTSQVFRRALDMGIERENQEMQKAEALEAQIASERARLKQQRTLYNQEVEAENKGRIYDFFSDLGGDLMGVGAFGIGKSIGGAPLEEDVLLDTPDSPDIPVATFNDTSSVFLDDLALFDDEEEDFSDIFGATPF